MSFLTPLRQEGLWKARVNLPAFFDGVVNLFLPQGCVACGAHIVGSGFCPSCWSELKPISPAMSDADGFPLPFFASKGRSTNRLETSDKRVEFRAATAFGEVARTVVHKLKYHDRHEVALPMSRMMALAGKDILARADYLMPVPLHRAKLAERRFNQSQLLARPLGRQTGLPLLADWLIRKRATLAQVGLSGEARRRNVEGAFTLREEARDYIAERNIVLIDDVITTGATARACAHALLDAGARRVDVLAFARVVPEEEGSKGSLYG